MWRKEDGNPQTSPDVSPNSRSSTPVGNVGAQGSGVPGVSSKAPACVSQGIKIKGELTGSEDLFVDGSVEGKITLSSSTLTVGPNAMVKADIDAREVVVRGRAEGKFTATERVQIWHTARVLGDIKAERISIEEGAELHGRLEAGKASASDAFAHQGKKSEADKIKGTHAGDEKSSSGATIAGAD